MAGQNEIDFIIIALGTMGMLILALALVAFVVFYQKKRINQQNEMQKRETQYQRELLNATIEEREKEQKRIALELHDDVGSTLTAIKMRLGKTELTEDDINDVREHLKDVVKQIRDISNDLLPPVLEELGLNGAIRNLCRRLSEQTTIKFNPDIPQTRNANLRKDEELAIYRVVQELINNILKHAGATQINITVTSSEHQYKIVLEDNGKGFTPPQRHDLQSTSLGMKNIASRVQQINAEINYELVKPQGTLVTLIRNV
jgi:signal transduction histidine kinase